MNAGPGSIANVNNVPFSLEYDIAENQAVFYYKYGEYDYNFYYWPMIYDFDNDTWKVFRYTFVRN